MRTFSTTFPLVLLLCSAAIHANPVANSTPTGAEVASRAAPSLPINPGIPAKNDMGAIPKAPVDVPRRALPDVDVGMPTVPRSLPADISADASPHGDGNETNGRDERYTADEAGDDMSRALGVRRDNNNPSIQTTANLHPGNLKNIGASS